MEDFTSNITYFSLFFLFMYGDARLDRITGWLCIFMGVGTSNGSRNSESAWHFRQGDPRAILTARQQIWRCRFRWSSESVSSGMSGRNSSTIFRKNFRIPLKVLLLKVSLVY